MYLEPESSESLRDFHPTPKIGDLKPISRKELNDLMKGKGLNEKKDYALRDLIAKFSFKPLVERRMSVAFLEGMELPSLTQ